MRPLHRPMFRYGGPIKEGVMSGIREPHARGSIAGGNQIGTPMGNRTGFADPVKNPGYWANLWGATKNLLSPTKKVKRVGKVWDKIKPTSVPKTKKGTYQGPVVSESTTKPNMWGILSPKTKISTPGYTSSYGIPMAERAGMWVRRNPGWTTAGAVGATSEPGQAILKAPFGIAKWTAEALTPKWGEKYLPWEVPGVESAYETPWGKDKKEDEKELTADELRIKQLEKLLASKEEPTVPQKSDAEIREEQIQKYRDIMDIKGMNKRAAYDSLIDASKLVSDSGDFKGDIRSGKLINDIIQATSKRYDKPAKTKDAIDTLILKGEIEKDIKSSMPTEAEKTAAAFGISKDEYKKKLLGKSSPAEVIANISTKTGRVDSTTVASGYKAAGIVPTATITDTIVDEWLEDKEGKTEIDYVKEVVSKADGFGPGLYVVGDRAILFDGTNYSYDY